MRPRPFSCTSLPALLMTSCCLLVTPVHSQVVNEDAKLLAFDGTPADAFGHAAAVYDGMALIGANNDNAIGSAYLMHLVLDGIPIKLTPNDGVPGDIFGHSVALGIGNVSQSSMFAAVGAPNHTVFGPSSGAAYLFTNFGTQLLKLTPNDGATGDNFGVSVAIDNGFVVVGTPEDDDNGTDSGSAYLFNALTGQQITKLLPDDGAPNDAFGHQVAISNNLIAISALRHHNNGIESGTVYIFDAQTGLQLGKFSSNEGVQFEQFGYSLSIDNGFVAVGALATATAYIYNANTFAQVQKILPSTPGNAFGWSIDLDGNKLVVGASLDPVNGIQSGSAFLFNAFTGNQIAKLIPSDGAVLDQFGSSAAIDNDLLVIGARNDNDNGSSSGSAYFFDIYCPADITGDGILDAFDVFAFISAYNALNPIADFTGDSIIDIFDVFAFIAAFNAGCP